MNRTGCRRQIMLSFFRRKIVKRETDYEASPDFYLKLVLLGDLRTGKTRLMEAFCCKACEAVYQGRQSFKYFKMVEFVDLTIQISQNKVLIRLYDTAGRSFKTYFLHLKIN